MTIRYVGLGHSHIVALAEGAYAMQRAGAPYDCRFHYLYDPAFHPAVPDPARPTELNPAVREAIAAHRPSFLVLSIGGNEHNVMSIAQTSEPYDFVLGEDPDAPVDESLRILPEAAIRETLREWMEEKTQVLRALRAAVDLPMVQIAPPPPLPRAQVLAYPKEFFKSAVDARNMSPERLRYKMWRVQTQLVRELSEELGILHVDAESDAVDGDGMLARPYWGADATHANAHYGEVVMRRALRQAETRFLAP